MALVVGGGGGWGRGGCGVGDYFAAAADENLLLALMVKVDIEDCGAAMIPDLSGDGKVEEYHAFGRLARADHGVAEERFGGERLESGKGRVDILEVGLFHGAGGDLFALGSSEGGGEVLEEEREVEAVVDAECSEHVESVLGVLVSDEDGVGFEDRVGWIDAGSGDGEVCRFVRSEAEEEGKNDAENEERQEYRCQQVASSGLSELEVGHWHEHSKVEVVSGRLKEAKVKEVSERFFRKR
jgi:hypothetical protein